MAKNEKYNNPSIMWFIELAKAKNIHKTTEIEEIKREILCLPKNVKINDIVNKAKQNIIIAFVMRTAIP